MVRKAGSGQIPAVPLTLCTTLVNYLCPLNLSSLIHKMAIITLPTSWDDCEDWATTHKGLRPMPGHSKRSINLSYY